MHEGRPQKETQEPATMKVLGEGESAVTTLKDAAAYLEIHENTLRRWGDKGLVPIKRYPSGVRRYFVAGIVQMREQMYAAFEESEISSNANLLLDEPRLNFTDEVSLMLQALAAGKDPEKLAYELELEVEKIEHIVNVGLRLLKRLPEK